MDIKHSALVPTGLAEGIWPISNTPSVSRPDQISAGTCLQYISVCSFVRSVIVVVGVVVVEERKKERRKERRARVKKRRPPVRSEFPNPN
jgi:hypothetical protein